MRSRQGGTHSVTARPEEEADLTEVLQITGRNQASVIVSVPHTGTQVPPDIAGQLTVPAARVAGRRDEYAWELAQAAAPVATVLRALCARAVIDLNRSGTVTGVDQSPDPEGDNERLVRLFGPDGELLWRARPGEAPLSTHELERRLKKYYDPYHDAVQRVLQRAPRPCVLLDMHSMDETAFDLVVGDFRGRSAGTGFCERVVCPFFTERGYRVGYAGPRPVDRRGRPVSEVAIRHSGGYITGRYGDPATGCHALQIEAARATARARLPDMIRDFAAFFRMLDAWMRNKTGAAGHPR